MTCRRARPTIKSICRALRLLSLVLAAVAACAAVPSRVSAGEQQATFDIKAFIVDGNTLLPGKSILDLLQRYKGAGRTAEDVEKARDSLEKVYHQAGYPAVLVNIPEQTTEGGSIHLQVIESKIGNVRVTGNRWFTREAILRDLPSLASGKVIYVPAVQKELSLVNRGEDIAVSPVLSPGREVGTTDVELKVKDTLPLHGNIEINNRYTPNTSDLRLNAMVHYDNLWQRGHSLSAQFQVSPQNTNQVRLYALSYTFPAPWAAEHQIAVYGLRSDSNTTVMGQGLFVTGKGEIVGSRYVIPLSPYAAYAHNLTVGLDFKDFQQTTGLAPGVGLRTPVKYMPMSFSYNSSLPDALGGTRFSGGLNMVFRGLVTEESNFAVNRYGARGNYIYLTAGVERDFRLPAGMGAFLKADGQVADQPLIVNEQYIGGGMTNVRGYQEAAVRGDNAVHFTAELSGPDIGRHLFSRLRLTPFIFYDFARLTVISPLPSQTDVFRIEGAGVGLKGGFAKYMYYELDFACPIASDSATDIYRQRWYFKVGAQF